ncbi:SDR family NAD(P)-dependent oxidoreductase [Streptomyces aquilus]|uniref:SDR family NAD(P)-dependent oxidoreductase n=1 Tax=Streptomyces aquilus TaxID=2548456 RepID=UPI001416F8AA|nr:SDR family NAD(P)-dependent oxidoreductase [Streptomyces aquilus]
MSQTVLITGGTSGIGLSLAQSFVELGASVVVCGRSQAALDRFAQAHPQALAVRADVTNPADRAALLQVIADRFGRLDVLVNNAGTFEERDYAAGTGNNPNATLDAEVALNLTAPIHLTGEVLERWPEPDSIVFITSGFALVSPTRAPTHGAVKAGLHGFADGLRRQLAPKGTHVLEVLPPSTDTPMNAEATGKKLTPEQVAAVTMKALRRGRDMAFPGQTKVMPAMLRIAPGTLRRVVAGL